ncbi:MAG: hypothetical protein ABI758_03745 [Candidatus Woesebacteria bacterium]
MIRPFALLSRVSLAILLCFLVLNTGVVYAVNPNIAPLKDRYRQLLDLYRTQSDALSLSLTQYKNLKTLASQEEAVHDMRDFLLTRDDVVITHLSILEAVLSDRTMVNPLWSASSSARIDADLKDLQDHRSRSDVAVDRIKADTEALWFIGKQKQLSSTADRAVCLIAIGHTQEAIDALQTVKKKIDLWIDTGVMSETQRVEKQRGSDELGRTIDNAQSILSGALIQYERQSQSGSATLMYPQLRSIVFSSYASVLRGVEFAKELSQ